MANCDVILQMHLISINFASLAVIEGLSIAS